jgi:hypothetical protein
MLEELTMAWRYFERTNQPAQKVLDALKGLENTIRLLQVVKPNISIGPSPTVLSRWWG